MTERHLKAVTSQPDVARADLEAAAILAEFGTPQSYERAQTLIGIAYLKGMRAGLDLGEKIALSTVKGGAA